MLLRSALWSRRFVRLPWASLTAIRHASSRPPLIRIENATFYQNYPSPNDSAKHQNPPLYPNLDFVLPAGPKPGTEPGPEEEQGHQRWAIVGSEGRDTFLNILRGQYISHPPNARSYPYLLSDEIAAKDRRLHFVGNAIQYIGFSGEGSAAIGGTRGAYLSARYESLREETDWTLGQFLKGQTSLNPLESEEAGNLQDDTMLNRVVADLHLEELLDMPVANLSNGQTRRARIAKALLKKPELLVIDEPFMGLDPAAVRGISNLLQRLAEKGEPRLILGLSFQDIIPDWITHLVVLGHANHIMFRGEREPVIHDLKKQRAYAYRGISNTNHGTFHDIRNGVSRSLLFDVGITRVNAASLIVPPYPGGEPLIEMDGVRVQYGEKTVLGDWKQKVGKKEVSGLHWTVRRGQRWAVLGGNGSGKTTLLSLITSDHPQAYALPIRLFGRSRLPQPGQPALSLFELQSRIGHSSPEIHAFFPRQLSIRQAIESAFADTFLSKPKLNHDNDLDVDAALRFFKTELDITPSTDIFDPKKAGIANHEYRNLFPPPLRKGKKVNESMISRKNRFMPPDSDVDWADNIPFGDLNPTQQRIVLFLRAIIHRPDIIILDEAFSGMPTFLRYKCFHFLEAGELGNTEGVTTPRRNSKVNVSIGNYHKPPPDEEIRHRGLSENQALIVVSHVKEEIPDSVRHFIRLPSDPGDGSEPLPFLRVALKGSSAMSDTKVWEAAWENRQYSIKPRRLAFQEGFRHHPDDEKKYSWLFL